MQDFYLKFVDEEQAQEVLYTKVVDEWSEPEDPDVEPIPLRWHYVPNYVNIDTIGIFTSHRLTHCQSHHLSLCLTLAGL